MKIRPGEAHIVNDYCRIEPIQNVRKLLEGLCMKAAAAGRGTKR